MPRLFRKFLIVIWVTVIGSLFAMGLILNAFQASPVRPQLEAQQREIVLDLAREILERDGVNAAERFAATSDTALAVGLSVSGVAGGACLGETSPEVRTIRQDGQCYRLSVMPAEGVASVRTAPAMLGLALLVSTLVAAVLLAGSLMKPIVNLRDGLRALAQGRYDVRIASRFAWRKDEVAALSKDFDATAERLQEHQEAQQRLFHDVSHELRSPLSRLQAVNGILRKHPAKLDTMLDRMDREVGRLDALVGEVLTLARLSARSDAPMKTQTLDVIEILNEILADAGFEARARGVTVTSEIDGAFRAEVDGEQIYRALENVIRNATKYTDEGSHVSVSCEPGAEVLTVRVTDRGPGVAPSDLYRIFQPFSRAGTGAQSGGYGLGLAIARQAVERHGGRVRAELPAGGGLAITLEIPRSPTGNSVPSERSDPRTGKASP